MRKLIGVAAVVLFGAAVVTVRALNSAPHVDPRLRAELVPLIQKHLETGHLQGGLLAAEYAALGPRVFCHVRLIETRERGAELLAGVHAECAELTKSGNALLSGTAFSMPMLVTLRTEGGARRVTGVEEPADGSEFTASVNRMFTDAGADEVDRIERSGTEKEIERLEDRARRFYSLPDDAPVRNP